MSAALLNVSIYHTGRFSRFRTRNYYFHELLRSALSHCLYYICHAYISCLASRTFAPAFLLYIFITLCTAPLLSYIPVLKNVRSIPEDQISKFGPFLWSRRLLVFLVNFELISVRPLHMSLQ